MSFYDRLLSATAALPVLQCSFHEYCCVQLTVTMRRRKADQTGAVADTLAVEALVVARGLLCRPSFLDFCNVIKEEKFAQPFIGW